MTDKPFHQYTDKTSEQQTPGEAQRSPRHFFSTAEDHPQETMKQAEEHLKTLQERLERYDRLYSAREGSHAQELRKEYLQIVRNAHSYKARIDSNPIVSRVLFERYQKCIQDLDGIQDRYQQAEVFSQRRDALSRRADDIMRNTLRPIFSLIKEPADRLDLSSYTKEGLFIPGLDISSLQPEEVPHTKVPDRQIEETYAAVFDHCYHFFTKAMPEEKDFMSIGLRGHQIAYVFTHYQACEHAFQEQIGLFAPQEVEQMKQEFSQRRRALEQKMGMLDIQGFLEKPGVLPADMHQQFTHDYQQIEAQVYNSGRLKNHEKLADRLRIELAKDPSPEIASVVEPLVGKNMVASYVSMLPNEGIAPRVASYVSMLPNEGIAPRVRISVARELETFGDRSIVPRLVEILENNEIHRSVRSSVVRTLETLGDSSIGPRLRNMLQSNDLPAEVYGAVEFALRNFFGNSA